MNTSDKSSFLWSDGYESSSAEAYGLFGETSVSSNSSHFQRRNFTNPSSNTQELIVYYNDIRAYIWTYVSPVIITVGVPCNILSLIVWIQSLVKKQGSTSSYFFASLAVADMIALLFLPMYDHIGIAYLNGLVLRNYNNVTCRFFMFMFGFSLSSTSYIVASLALFRMIGVLYPHHYKQICSARNAKIILVSILAFTLMVQVQTTIRSKVMNVYDGRGPVCKLANNETFVSIILALILMIVAYIIPMFTIVVSNLCIIWKLCKKRAQSTGTSGISNGAGDHAFSRTLRVLITVSVVYIFTMSPLWVYTLFLVGREWYNADKVQTAKYLLGWAIVSNICLLNFSANFFMYCLAHPQFLPDVKDCFWTFSTLISSAFPMCKKTNTIGIIHAEEVELGTAGTSGGM